MSVNKPKTKKSLWPITKDTDNPINQSKLEADTCSRQKARVNMCERVTSGFGFLTSDWLRKWRASFFLKCSNAKPKKKKLLVTLK